MTRRVGIVGGGVLGLTLAWRLARLGHQVDVLEAGGELGGLAGWHDYGPFTWDRFYHCILPQDSRLIGLLGELGLAGDLQWRETGTGYYGGGRLYPMSKSMDHLRFPLLSRRQGAHRRHHRVGDARGRPDGALCDIGRRVAHQMVRTPGLRCFLASAPARQVRSLL